jgi:hypothetical protein
MIVHHASVVLIGRSGVSAIIPAAIPTSPAQIGDRRIGSASSATTANPAAIAATRVGISSAGTRIARKHRARRSRATATGITLPAQSR